MLLCKITSFQECKLFDNGNMEVGSIRHPIDANSIFVQLCFFTDVINDFRFGYFLIKDQFYRLIKNMPTRDYGRRDNGRL